MQQLAAAAHKAEQTVLTAPIDGTVQQLAVHTVGGVVTPAQALLVVAPDEGPVLVEATVDNKDIGFVHAGQDVAVKVQTFEFTRYGLLHGHVVDVSRDRVGERDAGPARQAETKATDQPRDDGHPREPGYVAHIALDRVRMMVDGREEAVSPGMAVTAEIKTGRRSVISVLAVAVETVCTRGGKGAMTHRARCASLWWLWYVRGWSKCAVIMLAFWMASGIAHAQRSHINGGDAAEVGDLVVTHLAGHTLYVPKGYINSLLGYADNIMIHALLPCLVPETDENAAEFRQASIGKRIEVRLTTWESHSLEGQQLLDTDIANSEFVKERRPDQKEIDTGPKPVPGTGLVAYKDLLLSVDVFVLRDSHPLFLVRCAMHAPWLPSHMCKVWERIWGNVRLEYRLLTVVRGSGRQ